MLKNFIELEQQLKNKVTVPKRIALVKAANEHALHSVLDFARNGYLIPILIDDKEKLEKLLSESDTTNCSYEIIDESDDALAAKKGVELIREGKADFLMKGHLETATLLKEVVNRETGIRDKDVLFHLAILDVPKYDKLLGITDGGMLLTPTLEQKIQVIEASSEIFKRLGYTRPKVSLLSAAEKVNAKLQSSVEAHDITMQLVNNPNYLVEGPLSLDISLNKEIAEQKGYSGEIKGDADILVVPDIVAGNTLAKSLTLMSGANMSGLVLGAKVPIVLTSRGATEEEKKYSLTLALLVSGGN